MEDAKSSGKNKRLRYSFRQMETLSGKFEKAEDIITNRERPTSMRRFVEVLRLQVVGQSVRGRGDTYLRNN